MRILLCRPPPPVSLSSRWNWLGRRRSLFVFHSPPPLSLKKILNQPEQFSGQLSKGPLVLMKNENKKLVTKLLIAHQQLGFLAAPIHLVLVLLGARVRSEEGVTSSLRAKSSEMNMAVWHPKANSVGWDGSVVIIVQGSSKC